MWTNMKLYIWVIHRRLAVQLDVSLEIETLKLCVCIHFMLTLVIVVWGQCSDLGM